MRNPHILGTTNVRVYTFKELNECLDENENF